MFKRSKQPARLFTLLVTCFVGFNSLLLLLSGLAFYGTYSELAYREIRDAKQQLLDETSRKLSSYVAGIQDTARFVVTNTLVQQLLSEPPAHKYDYVSKSRRLYEEFRKMVTVKPGLHSIELYTDWSAGFPPFQEQFMHPLAQAEEEGWLMRLEKADAFWLPSRDVPVSDGTIRMISYVQRIQGFRGENLGVVKLNIPEEGLFNILLGDMPADERHYYAIADAGGNLIAARLPPEISARDGPGGIEDGAAGGGRDGAASGDAGGVEGILRAAAGTSYNVIRSDAGSEYWTLMEFISRDVFQQSERELRLLTAGLLAVLLLVSVPLVLWLSRMLAAPIRSIVEGMHAVEKGNFSVRLKGSRVQEYTALTANFNRMVQRLDELIDRLDREHRKRREVEMQLMLAQIKPHFLYNTLDMIHWRALDYGAEDISRMVQQLSRLFRIGLSNDRWYVTLRDELMHARTYIAIQQFRQAYPIAFEEAVDRELYECYLPKIVLQPFLENAVVHGFRNWPADRKAEIRVTATAHREPDGEELRLTVADNGRGLPETFDVRRDGGIGIRNVQDRIHLYFGYRYGVTLRRREEGGTIVEIRLPLIRSEDEIRKLTGGGDHENDSARG